MTPTLPDEASLRAVTVASWFPAMDDTIAGRFVADQVEALRSTRVVEPIVVSFELAQLAGGRIDRQQQAAAIRHLAGSAVASRPDVFAPRGWSGPPGVPVARLPIAGGSRGISSPAHQALARRELLGSLASRIRTSRPTIIHAHTGYPDGAAAAALMEPLDAPLVITEHASFVGRQLAQPDLREAYVGAIRQASRLIAVSQSLAEELRGALPDCRSKLVVIPNTVAIDSFQPVPLASRRPDELLYVGYRTEKKGVDVLLAAFARVRARRPTATLRLIGRSPTEEIEDDWHRLAAQLGIEEAVVFDEPMLRSGVAAAMARASILVHASRWETFGMVPVEALASGLPIVASATGGLLEILGPDPTALGALVPVGDSEELASAILATLQRRESFDPAVLRSSVDVRFGGAAVAQRIVDLYREILAEQRRSVRQPWPHQPETIPAGDSSKQPHRPSVVVAFDTAKLARLLALLPEEQRRVLTIVCSAGHEADLLPGDLRAVVTADTDSVHRGFPDRVVAVGPRGGLVTRIRRFVGDPRTAVLRRWVRRQRDALRRRAVARAVDEAAGTASPRVPVDIVCLDGLDFLLAGQVVAAGRAEPVPGGLRWLADKAAPAQAQRVAGSMGLPRLK